MIGAIWAQSVDGVIGDGQGMPWHMPEDLRHFKITTMGSPVIMGRRTWLSLPKRPLPGRDNYVVSSKEPGNWSNGAFVFPDVPDLATDTWIIGGARLYESMMDMLDIIEVTVIDAIIADAYGDEAVFAPAIPEDEFALMHDTGWLQSESGHLNGSDEPLRYRFLTYDRKVAKEHV
ncbi:dihydrofolate reductase [Corynebacterium sp. S7]